MGCIMGHGGKGRTSIQKWELVERQAVKCMLGKGGREGRCRHGWGKRIPQV